MQQPDVKESRQTATLDAKKGHSSINRQKSVRILKELGMLAGVSRLMRLRISGSFVQAICEIGFSLFLMRTIDAMVATDISATWRHLASFTAFLGGMALATGFNTWLSGLVSARCGGALRTLVADRYASLGYGLAMEQTGASVQTLLTTALRPVQDYCGRDLPAMFLYGAKFIMAILLMGFLNWKLMLASVLLIPLFVWLSGKTGDPLQARMRELVEEQGHVNGLLAELQAGLPVVKAFRIAGRMLQRFQLALDAYFRTAVEVERKRAAILFFEIFLNYAPFISSFLLGGWFAVQGTLSAGGLLAFVQLVGCIAEPSAMAPVLLARRKMALGAADSLLNFLSLPSEHAISPPQVLSERKETETETVRKRREAFSSAIPDAGPALLMNQVAFSRGGRFILESISLSIPKGSVTAIVGPSGSGKTTLLHLMAGLLEPDSGHISLPALHPDHAHLPGSVRRKAVSLVTQQPVLFPWSIRENVACANPDDDEDALEQALLLSGTRNFLPDIADGLDTVLDESGKGLSGGQSQRITIARALLKKAPLLLLDEPTSALDRTAENGIVDLLEGLRGRTTVILTAHRLSTIQRADSVILLQNGKAAAIGTHQALYESHGEYRSLCEDMGRPAPMNRPAPMAGEVTA